ncbi:MAG: hypothetical protein AAGA18_04470 [Verrucomicrobiota bacterium]
MGLICYLTRAQDFIDSVAKIRVIEETTLYGLADALLWAIDFDLDHAFGFHSSLKSPYDRKMERFQNRTQIMKRIQKISDG